MRKLVSAYKVEKISLKSLLLYSYVNHGIKIIKILEYIQGHPLSIYNNIANRDANERRNGQAEKLSKL